MAHIDITCENLARQLRMAGYRARMEECPVLLHVNSFGGVNLIPLKSMHLDPDSVILATVTPEGADADCLRQAVHEGFLSAKQAFEAIYRLGQIS